MAGISDNEKLDITCPKCSAKFRKTIRELKGTGVRCPKCGVCFETSGFRKGLDQVDRSLKDFSRNLRNLNLKF